MNDLAHGQEAISALADGQLRGEEFARAVESATASAQALATWHAYHVVGDVLRCGALAACRQDLDFVARLKTRLHHEQFQASAGDVPDFVAENIYPTRDNSQNLSERPAANEAVFRWKLVAGFASLAAVAAVSWSALRGGSFVTASQPQLAQAVVSVPTPSGVAAADSAAPVVIRDPRLDAFLAAHEQFVGTSALQMPSGFFRNATFEGSTR